MTASTPEPVGEPVARGVHHGRVEWADTDAAGIYHNSAVTRYVESAEAALMRSRGLDGYFPRAPRVHYEVHFEAPLRFGQELTAVVDLQRIGTSSMTFAFEVWAEAHQGRARRRAASGGYVTVHVDGDHAGDDPARSSPWPPDWLDSLRGPARAARGEGAR